MKKKLIIIVPVLLVVCILVSAACYIGYSQYYIPKQINEYSKDTKAKFEESTKELDETKDTVNEVFASDSNGSELEDSINMANKFIEKGDELKRTFENSSSLPADKPSHNIDRLHSLLSEYYSDYDELVKEYEELSTYFQKSVPLVKALDDANKALNDGDSLDPNASEEEFIEFVDNYVEVLDKNADALEKAKSDLKTANIPDSVKNQNEVMILTVEPLIVYLQDMSIAFGKLKQSYLTKDVALFDAVSAEVSEIENDYSRKIGLVDTAKAEGEDEKIKESLVDKIDALNNKEVEIRKEFEKVEKDYGKILFGLVK